VESRALIEAHSLWWGLRAAVGIDTTAFVSAALYQSIVEGELPFFGFPFEGLAPPVTPRATAAIPKHSSRVRTLDDYLTEERISPGRASSSR